MGLIRRGELVFEPYDRGTYKVLSRSETEGAYVVDVVERTCGCKGFETSPEPKTCWHLEQILSFVLNGDEEVTKPKPRINGIRL